jgi:hypothetical protein
MRPKCGVPRWKLASKRGTRTSIGPKIMLAAILVVAGVIGIGGIYPQVTDAEWVRDAVGTHPSPPRRATNTGQASVSAPNRAPVTELSQSVAAIEPLLDAAAEPNALPAHPVGAAAAKSGDKPGNKPTDKARVATAKKRVVRLSTTDGTLPPTFSTAPAGAVGLVARPASSHSAIGSEPQPHRRRRARVVEPKNSNSRGWNHRRPHSGAAPSERAGRIPPQPSCITARVPSAAPCSRCRDCWRAIGCRMRSRWVWPEGNV